MDVNSTCSAIRLEGGTFSITLPVESLIYLSIERMETITFFSKIC